MAVKQVKSRSIESEVLHRLKTAGADSGVLAARLAYSDAEGLGRYARGMLPVGDPLRPKNSEVNFKDGRVYPDVLMHAQASMRFSTTKPPLVNFPAKDGYGVAWGMIVPDPGWLWVHFDMSALHARIAVAYTHDPVDKEAFENDWDCHTLTACQMFGYPLPPIRTKSCHDSPECETWRLGWADLKVQGVDPIAWTGEKDRRRRLAKVFRYATLLGRDERAALESKEVAELGLEKEEILRFGRLYLKGKPVLVAAKKRIFAELAEARMARAFDGSLRRLYGDVLQRGKDGWSHVLQAGEQAVMQPIILDIHQEYRDARYVLDSHDGYTFGVPEGTDLRELRFIVERVWKINGSHIRLPAEFEIVLPDGTFHPLLAS